MLAAGGRRWVGPKVMDPDRPVQRSPARVAPDPAAGDPGVFVIGDVGWDRFEEMNVCYTGGMNFGWPVVEGRECFPPDEPCDPTGFEPPILTYRHAEGEAPTSCSVTGGFVYHGQAMTHLDALYEPVPATWLKLDVRRDELGIGHVESSPLTRSSYHARSAAGLVGI